MVLGEGLLSVGLTVRVPSPGPLLRIGTVKAAVEAPAGTRMVPDWAESCVPAMAVPLLVAKFAET